MLTRQQVREAFTSLADTMSKYFESKKNFPETYDEWYDGWWEEILEFHLFKKENLPETYNQHRLSVKKSAITTGSLDNEIWHVFLITIKLFESELTNGKCLQMWERKEEGADILQFMLNTCIKEVLKIYE